MTRWPDDHIDQMTILTRWPDDQMTIWPYDHSSRVWVTAVWVIESFCIFQKKKTKVNLKMQSTTNSCDFTDVTLAMHDGPTVCRHYQTGFCKFGKSCRKQHVKEICQMNNCNLKICTQRHPKVCKYFKHRQHCKFGDSCCYRHDIVEPRGGLLEKQIEALK